MRKILGGTALAALILPGAATAEMEIGLYLGTQDVHESRVTGDVDGTPLDVLFAWEGRSTAAPPYYGAKFIYWRESDWGFGVEFTHAKAYAPDGERAAAGFDAFEFTDGHNIITANVHRRWSGLWAQGRLTPYVTGGLGIALPHVDITPTGDTPTFEYQLTGPAARVGAGLTYELTDNWNIFGEAQLTWSDNEIDLTGGGTLETSFVTRALNLGVSFDF